MAVLSRVRFGSAERLDLPDILSIDSYTAGDFKYFIKSFVGSDNPYILRGFDVIQPQDSIGTQSISIRTADSVVYYPGAEAGSFFYGLEEGNVNAQPLVPTLRKNATNYVYLTFTTSDGAQDSRAFWDPDQNGGAGGEFSQDINTETTLMVEVNVSTSTFPQNTIPICKVAVGPTVITNIEDSRSLLFRLGTGGITPDPFSNYNFRNYPSAPYARLEPPTLMTLATDPNPFQGGDKNFYTFKEWMDVVMTKLKELSGTAFWYEQGLINTSVSNIFLDSLGSTIKSKGDWQHSDTTPGEVTWTEDIHYLSLIDPRDLIFRANTVTLTNDEQVAFINLIRNREFNSGHQVVTWTNGNLFVNGIVGAFANLAKGDWVKKKTDTASLFLRVEEFYTGAGGAGGTTTAALAQSILLSNTYQGVSNNAIGDYTQGVYDLADVQVVDRNDAAILAAGGDFYWLAIRSDTVLGFGGATPTTLSLTITAGDGTRAKCTNAGVHGLIDGDHITIPAGDYAGTYDIEVENTTMFYIKTTVTTAGLPVQAAYYAVVTTVGLDNGHSLILESANHNFQSGQKIYIEDTLTAYDSNYIVNVRTPTTFQIAISSSIPNPGVIGYAISHRVNVRTEFGVVKIIQGESIHIGEADAQNLLSFIGMRTLSETHPEYSVPSSYNAIDGYQDYNSDSIDSLTTRTSKLTAMMADRVQDRGMNIWGRSTITSTLSGSTINITASAPVYMSGLPRLSQQLTLTCSLNTFQVAVCDIDRNNATAMTLSIIDLSLGQTFELQENRMIVFIRGGGTDVIMWNGMLLPVNGNYTCATPEDAATKSISVLNPFKPTLNRLTGLVDLNSFNRFQVSKVICQSGGSIVQNSYFQLYSADNTTQYFAWFNVDTLGVQPAGTGTPIEIAVNSVYTASQVAAAMANAIDPLGDFSATNLSTVCTITNSNVGWCSDLYDVDTLLSMNTTVQGQNQVIRFNMPGYSSYNYIESNTIDALGTLVLSNDQAAWVRLNRNAGKAFNTISLLPNTPDSTANGAIYITARNTVPKEQDVFILFYRLNDKLYKNFDTPNSEDDLPINYAKITNSITSSYPISYNDHIITIDTSGGTQVALWLPPVLSEQRGRQIVIKDIGGKATAWPITVIPDGADTIDGESSFIMENEYQSNVLVCRGTSGWSVI